MNSVLRHHRYGRALGAGVLSVALLSGGTTGAFAATHAQTPAPTPSATRSGTPNATPSMTRSGTPTARPSMTRTGTPSMRPSRTPTMMGSITISANRKVIKVGNTVVFTGRVTGVKRGSALVLQRRVNGKWTTLTSTTIVSNSGRYTIKWRFANRGTQQVRVATKSGTLHSSPVTVRVS